MADHALLLMPDPDTVFEEPWQAEAFATAVHLSRKGAFTWPEWVDAFGKSIKANPQRADEGFSTAYYRQWISTLESLTSDRLQLAASLIDGRQADWERAYRNTIHGQPVDLANAEPHHHHDEGHHDHHHGDMHRTNDGTPQPVAVSPAVYG